MKYIENSNTSSHKAKKRLINKTEVLLFTSLLEASGETSNISNYTNNDTKKTLADSQWSNRPKKTQEDLSEAQGMAKSNTLAAKNVYENMLN